MLVNPRQFPHPEATARASGADDVLAQARVVGHARGGARRLRLVAATTSRERDQYFRVAGRARRGRAARVARHAAAPAAVLFGAERTGLTNEELERAHLLIRIPANPTRTRR